MILKATDLCFKSGKRYLLKDINWEINKGDHWLIFGLNGSGKTTLLSIIAGFKSPSSGKLEIFGEQFDKNNVFALRKKIGWVSSSFFDKIFYRETALEIVLSGLTGTLGLDFSIKDKDVRKAKELLAQLNMDEKAKYQFGMLSKGERQNILIARALINAPEVLVLDEMSTGLDIYAREKMSSLINLLAMSGKATIVYVTHYPQEVQPFMNKTMLLRNGRVLAQGDTQQVLNKKNLEAMLNNDVEIDRAADGTWNIKTSVECDIVKLCYE